MTQPFNHNSNSAFVEYRPVVHSLLAVKLSHHNFANVVAEMIQLADDTINISPGRLIRVGDEADGVTFGPDEWVVAERSKRTFGIQYRHPTDEERIKYGLR